MALSTIASMNSEWPQIYEDALFVIRDQNLMANLVTPYSSTGWAPRNVPVYPAITAETVAEGVDFSHGVEWTKTANLVLTPKQIMAQVILTDQRRETDPQDARRDAALEMGNSVATQLDADLVAVFASFSSDQGTAGSALTLTRVANAFGKLRNAKARGPFYVVVHPYHWIDLWTEMGQPAATYANLADMTSQALQDYFVGNFMGAQWFQSANIATNSSDDAVSGVFSREAIALDTREQPTLEVERDASLRAFELNMTAGYATGIRRSTFGVALTADATAPTG